MVKMSQNKFSLTKTKDKRQPHQAYLKYKTTGRIKTLKNDTSSSKSPMSTVEIESYYYL